MSEAVVPDPNPPPGGGAQGPPVVRPPNRPAHERHLEELCAALGAKEGRRRFLQDRLKGIREQLGRCRADREAITEERNQVDNQLSGINKEVRRGEEEEVPNQCRLCALGDGSS